MELGQKLKKARMQRGLSQGELAQKVGLTPTHLGRLEKGRFQPSVEAIKKLAQALETSVDYLLSEAPAEELPPQTAALPIANSLLLERLRFIDALEKADQEALIRVIDSMLTRQQLKRFLKEEPVLASS